MAMLKTDHWLASMGCLAITTKVIQRLVFGELRVSEVQNLKEKAKVYLYHKVLFVCGIIGVHSFEETMPWAAWYSVLGLLLLVTYLCKDRFEYLVLSPTTPTSSLVRLCLTMILVLGSSLACLVGGIQIGQQLNWDTLFYLLADSLYVVVMAIFVLARYAIHVYDTILDKPWEERASFTYYTDLFFELTLLSIDFINHLHMFRVNSLVSVPTILCGIKLHSLFREIKLRHKRHKNYLAVVRLMESNFPMATGDELEHNSDDCSICWDKMETARKLPCGHLFHSSCLRSWLEQDTSCPTCRSSLKWPNQDDDDDNDYITTDSDDDTDSLEHGAPMHIQGQLFHRNSQYFHFDTSRYSNHPLLRWLPAISIEASWLGSRENFDFDLDTDRLDRYHRLQPGDSTVSSSASASIWNTTATFTTTTTTQSSSTSMPTSAAVS